MITDIYNKLKGMVIGLSPLYLLTLLLITTSCNKVVETDEDYVPQQAQANTGLPSSRASMPYLMLTS